nr:sulfite exporter TauE/SafE family protein [Massilia sp. TS11]
MAALCVGLSKGGLAVVSGLAVPLMALSMPPLQAAMLLLPIYIVSDLAGLWIWRRAASRAHLRVLLPAALAGVALGWATASLVSDAFVKLLLGVSGAGFCLLQWAGWPRREQPPGLEPAKGRAWGLLAGFSSFISHAGGPPFQMYMLPQQLPKAMLAGTSTVLFAVVNLSKLLPYHLLRPYSLGSLGATAQLIPFALLGTWLGARLTHWLPEVWFYRLVRIGLFLLSLRLIWEACFMAA